MNNVILPHTRSFRRGCDLKTSIHTCGYLGVRVCLRPPLKQSVVGNTLPRSVLAHLPFCRGLIAAGVYSVSLGIPFRFDQCVIQEWLEHRLILR